MKQKKNTKSKVLDIIVVLICLTGMAVSLWTFWKELNETLTKQSETPVGEIVFKRKSAQRRFADTVVWDRLRQRSPVYNGDTIRTAALSQADIYFAESTAGIELSDNSIIQLWVDEDGGTMIDLLDGNISIDKQDSSGSLTLRSGGNEISVETRSRINLQIDTVTEEVSITIIEGSASLSNEQGSRTIDAGSALKISPEGMLKPFITVVDIIAYPDSYMLETSPNNIPVRFIWNSADLAADEIVRLEISEGRTFSAITQSADVTAGAGGTILTLNSAGTYYWRIYPASAGNDAQYIENASSGKFVLVYSEPPRLIAPAEGYAYQYRTKKPAVRMSWSSLEDVSRYRVEIANNSQMNNPEIIISYESSMINSGLDAGSRYWRVSPIYPGGFMVNAASSSIGNFRIEQRGELQAPEPVIPLSEAVFYMEEENASVRFSWKHNPEAASYNIQISSSQNLENTFFSEELTNNFYSYNISQNGLRAGRYYWAVNMTDSEGNKSPFSESRAFFVMEKKEKDIRYTAVFPPDNYTVNESEIQDTVFTWESSLPFPNRFQISADIDFSDPLIDEITTASDYQIETLPPGDYFWRIVTVPDTAVPPLSGVPRVLKIMPSPEPEDEPIPLLPAVKEDTAASLNEHVFGIDELAENKGINFEWQPVPEADRYIFSLYVQDSSGRLKQIVEDQALDETSFALNDFSILDTGNFVWRVEAQSLASDGTVDKRGEAAEFSFSIDLPEVVTIETEAPGTLYGN